MNDHEQNNPIDSLKRPVILDELNNTLWNDKCDYMELGEIKSMNPNNYNLLILQVNIRSLIAHQGELRQLLQKLSSRNCSIDAVLLCETFLTKATAKMVNIPGYNHIYEHRHD